MLRIQVFDFDVGDVDEPHLVMPMIIDSKLKGCEKGQWVLDNSQNLRYSIQNDGTTWGYHIIVEAEVDDAAATYFQLCWG